MNNNNLVRKDDFKGLLEGYKPGTNLLNLLPSIELVLLVAPAATGRNTIIRELVKTGNYHYLVSDTTRKQRTNDGKHEISGEEYWFKTEDEFIDGLKRGDYLGPAIIHDQQVSAISIDELARAKKSGKVAITDMDIQGSEDIYNYKNDTKIIFLLPPSYKEWMRRLDQRGVMSQEEKRRRLSSATKEIKLALGLNNLELFMNHDLLNSVSEINNYITKGVKPYDTNTQIREHAQDLLSNLEKQLS